MIEELIEFAERVDTEIEFVENNPALNELDGVGGLLRFKRYNMAEVHAMKP